MVIVDPGEFIKNYIVRGNVKVNIIMEMYVSFRYMHYHMRKAQELCI